MKHIWKNLWFTIVLFRTHQKNRKNPWWKYRLEKLESPPKLKSGGEHLLVFSSAYSLWFLREKIFDIRWNPWFFLWEWRVFLFIDWQRLFSEDVWEKRASQQHADGWSITVALTLLYFDGARSQNVLKINERKQSKRLYFFLKIMKNALNACSKCKKRKKFIVVKC